MKKVYHFKHPYWRESPMSRTTAIQLLFDWDYPMVWTLSGYGSEFVHARMDSYKENAPYSAEELLEHVVSEIDLKSGLIAFLELILKPITTEEAKLFGPMTFFNISDFFGPLSARDPEQAIQTCFGFMHVHEKFLFTPTRQVITRIYPPRPKKWYNLFYQPVPIEKRETIMYQPASLFKHALFSVPCPGWTSIAAPLISKMEDNLEELFFMATEDHMQIIGRVIPQNHFTLKQYHLMLHRLHRAGLNRY